MQPIRWTSITLLCWPDVHLHCMSCTHRCRRGDKICFLKLNRYELCPTRTAQHTRSLLIHVHAQNYKRLYSCCPKQHSKRAYRLQKALTYMRLHQTLWLPLAVSTSASQTGKDDLIHIRLPRCCSCLYYTVPNTYTCLCSPLQMSSNQCHLNACQERRPTIHNMIVLSYNSSTLALISHMPFSGPLWE